MVFIRATFFAFVKIDDASIIRIHLYANAQRTQRFIGKLVEAVERNNKEIYLLTITKYTKINPKKVHGHASKIHITAKEKRSLT